MASHWIPQDDFLLRKSIESGASLESLAKGAIKFSRKFTLSELTDRWHSLLYDPNVTSLSSSIGFDIQYSAQLLPERHHHHTTQVRSHYYATAARKRMRVEEEPLNHVAYGDDVFGASTVQDLFLDDFVEFDVSQFECLRFSPEIMQDCVNNDDADGDRIMNQLLNINGGEIQGCNVVTDTTTQHVLLQDPMFQQHNTSFYENTSSQSHHKQEEIYQAIVTLPELDLYPEIKEGILICTLNTESDEIPDNSDFNPQLCNPRARNSINPSASSSSFRKHMKPPPPPIRISSSSLQAKGNETVHNYGFGDGAKMTQANSSSAFKESFTIEIANVAATTSTSLQRSPENEICEPTLSAKIDMKNPSMSEDGENNNEIESDEDLPSFSDVEDMILDMDLEPLGQNQYELEASRYLNLETMRMIMRLEQSSASYMNRNIASHGALAILYGSSKHYINKPEVLLGRATGEYLIDIDLGSSEKISRRQALIKLKEDGRFEIKNLGKFSIWMNEKEIAHHEVVDIKNHCLIQIRGMSFIFEMNKRAVKRYLDSIHK